MMIKEIEVMTEREHPNRRKKTRIYFHPEGESILENLANRRNRPYNEYRRLLDDVFREVGIRPKRVNWSRYAGCSCGCSPGFIVGDDWNREVFVTVTD